MTEMEQIKILVVDDEPENRDALIAGLIDNGFKKENVIAVETGKEAVRLVEEKPEFFDVAVVDHILNKDKELDGIKTTAKIRVLSRKIFPIIFTNIPTDDPKNITFYRIKAYEAGAYRYMDRSGAKQDVHKVKDFIFEIMQLSQLKEKVQKYYDAQYYVPSLLTQLDIMVALIDRGHKVWYMNEASKKFNKLYDLPLKPCSAAFRGVKTMCPCSGCIVSQTLEDSQSRECTYLRPVAGFGGQLKWVHVWTQPMPDEKGKALLLDDGKPIAVLESSQDLTNSVRLKNMSMEERLSIIAQALNDREDGFDRVRIYKATTQRKLEIVAYAGYPRQIQPDLLDIEEFTNIKRSIRHFKQHSVGLFHDKPGNQDTIFPDELLEKFIQWPLMKGEKLLGLISVSAIKNGRPCTEDGIDIMADYMEEASKAFDVKKGSPKALEFEEKFFAVDNLLIQKRTPEDTIQTLVSEASSLTGSDNVLIRYRDENEPKARLLPIGKGAYMDVAPLEISFSNRIVPSVMVMMNGQELLKKNAKNDPEVAKFKMKLPEEARENLEEMEAYCIEPLIFKNRCIGSLTMFKNGEEKYYNEKEIEIAREIAERMALAVRDYLANIGRMRKDYAFESSINGVAFADLNDTLDYMNNSFLKLWGYKNQEEVLGKPVIDLWENKKMAARILKMLHDDESWIGELVALKKDGTPFDVQLSANPLKDKTGKIIGTVATFIDISERKRLEKVQESIYRISEEASSAQNLDELYKEIHNIIKGLMPADNFYIALYDEKTESVSFPYAVDEYEAPPPDPRPRKRGMTEYVIRNGKPILATAKECEELERKGEIDRYGEPSEFWLGVPLKTMDNKIIGVLVVQIYKEGKKYTEEDKDMLEFVSTQIAMAIERKQEQQKKEVMLQEIHHRVKNNFNFISSLVDLQSRQIKDQQVKEQFNNTRERIMLMAMVHDKLYQSGNLSEIDFTRYVKDLVNSLQQLHALEGEKVSIELKVDRVLMGIDKAIPCGLIINELLTNAFKYAFPDDTGDLTIRNNRITVELTSNGKNNIKLGVKDNGVGLPKGLDFFETPSLGLRLIRLLKDQIHGTLKLDQTSGTTVEITFNV